MYAPILARTSVLLLQFVYPHPIYFVYPVTAPIMLIKSKEKTFPCLIQTGESFSLHLKIMFLLILRDGAMLSQTSLDAPLAPRRLLALWLRRDPERVSAWQG